MPNYCSNTATFKHADTDQIRKVIDAFNQGKLLDTFVTCPPELRESVKPGENYVERVKAKEEANLNDHGYKDWYDWSVDNWGTKWDVGAEGEYDAAKYTPGQTEVTLSFDSAWSPPLSWYNEMADEFEFEIAAYYLEEGMGFCGKWTNEDWDAEGYEFESVEDLDDIPDDIIEHWDLRGILESREDDDDGEDDEDGEEDE